MIFSKMVMKGKVKNYIRFLGSLITIIFVIALISYAGESNKESIPTGELPLLITTAGQSPGGMTVSVICKRNSVDHDYLNLATVEDLTANHYNTLIITMGTSGKGMGAAGIDIDDELDRIEKIIEEAKRQNIFIIGMHIEVEARRGGHCEKTIDLVAPLVDYLIVRSDGNQDGRFDRIAEEKNIPTTIIDGTIELNDLLKKIFLNSNK
jgi:hypothetical protein